MACHNNNNSEAHGTLELDEPVHQAACRQCQTAARLVRTIMDSATGRSVRMFECSDCGTRTWDD
jgi:hypothetical protein